jgi:dihydroorotate dehydrogenase (NAD+) catalytic subunit
MSQVGGLITKAITLLPCEGNLPPRCVETDAGMLNSIGLANIGLDRFVHEKLPIIRKMGIPVLVNVAGSTVDQYAKVISTLAAAGGIAGFELNVSCPNVDKGGISFGTDQGMVSEVTAAAKAAAGGRPVFVKLTALVTDIVSIARAAVEAGADGLSLINTIPGMAININTRRPVLGNRTGGLSGPAIRPVAVYIVDKVYRELARDAGIPIIGGGGIMDAADALEFIIAGADAVAVGTGTFVDPGCAAKVARGIRDYCVRHGIRRIKELVGSLC